MRVIDEQYTKTPFYGARRMSQALLRQGVYVGRRRTRRLMRGMGLEAIYPAPRLSAGGHESRKYPYLLRGLAITHPNQVWCADITYIRLAKGFAYLVAVMDWYSRRVLSWELSTALDADFCVTALHRALRQETPEIFNSDQGVQFTSQAHTEVLEGAGVRISLDGRGRAFDNIFIERLWRSVKYESVYLHDWQCVADARAGLAAYFRFYNEERPHQALGYRTPNEVHYAKRDEVSMTCA